MKIFCFDLDGVICKTKQNKYSSAKPIKKVIDLINKLYEKIRSSFLQRDIWADQVIKLVLQKKGVIS